AAGAVQGGGVAGAHLADVGGVVIGHAFGEVADAGALVAVQPHLGMAVVGVLDGQRVAAARAWRTLRTFGTLGALRTLRALGTLRPFGALRTRRALRARRADAGGQQGQLRVHRLEGGAHVVIGHAL